MNRRSFLKSLGGLSLVPVVGVGVAYEMPDGCIVNYRDAIPVTSYKYARIINDAFESVFITKHVDALERRV